MENGFGFPEEYIGLIVGAAAAFLLIMSAIVTIIIIRNRRGKNSGRGILTECDHRISAAIEVVLAAGVSSR